MKLGSDSTSTDGNPIVELARQTGTTLHRWKQNTLILDRAGSLVSSDLANTALELVWQVLEDAINHSSAHSSQISPAQSLHDYFVDWCRTALTAGRITSEQRDLVLDMASMWGAYVGDRVERQSLKFFFLEDCIDGDDFFIPSNYKKIMAAISQMPLDQARLVLNKVMISVKHGCSSPGSVCVTTSDGEESHFDRVVVTTPLGWLKKHPECIETMPTRIAQAIRSISFGRLEKVGSYCHLHEAMSLCC
jgi:hypothetical protein